MPSSASVNVDTWIVRGNAAFVMRNYEMSGSWFAQVFIDLTQSPGTAPRWGSWQASLAVFERGTCSEVQGGPVLPNMCNGLSERLRGVWKGAIEGGRERKKE
jgi:hypothetical protein